MSALSCFSSPSLRGHQDTKTRYISPLIGRTVFPCGGIRLPVPASGCVVVVVVFTLKNHPGLVSIQCLLLSQHQSLYSSCHSTRSISVVTDAWKRTYDTHCVGPSFPSLKKNKLFKQAFFVQRSLSNVVFARLFARLPQRMCVYAARVATNEGVEKRARAERGRERRVGGRQAGREAHDIRLYL